MTKIKIKILCLIAISVSSINCASFTKKGFREEIIKLDDIELNQLSGNYTLKPVKNYYNSGDYHSISQILDSSNNLNGYYFLTNEDHDKKQAIDSLYNINNEYHFSLKLLNSKSIRLALLENSTVIADTIFEGKIKKGMFYIKNNFLDCHGIPYLFGGCTNIKKRIGLTKNGNLLINVAFYNAGGALLIFNNGYSYNTTYEFQKM